MRALLPAAPLLLVACASSSAGPAEPLDAHGCPAAYSASGPKEGWNTGFRVAGQSRSFQAIFPDTARDTPSDTPSDTRRDTPDEPPHVSPASSVTPAPLFVAFNGTSEDGAGFARRADLARFAARGFVVISASSNGNGSFWPVWDGLRARGEESAPNPDIAFFDALVACTSAHRAIDPARIYVGGHSAGGIFTNHLLQRRSDVIAGGIVASGVYSQTSPVPPVPLSPLTVIVTWGGPNDRWTGRAGSSAVQDFGFVSEASVASKAYARAPGVGVVTCEGASLGHAWLPINDWMIDVLLAHPKGGPPLETLPPLPSGAPVRCALGPWDDAPVSRLECPTSTVAGCQDACQRIADGAVSNRTVGPVLRRELRRMGFGEGCGGCVARCAELARTPADAEVLACLQTAPPVDLSVGGITGAMPLIDGINTCCAERDDSPWCVSVCGELRHNLAARSYFGGCPG